jgi:hypothetical protein
LEGLRSGGQPLPANVRTDMETTFGEDFSDVRVHTGSTAALSSTLLGAKAYTLNNHIVFRPGQFQPGTGSGRRTLAHELAHVAQNRGQPATQSSRIDGEGSQRETEASLASRAAGSGQLVNVSRGAAPAISLRRDPDLITRLDRLRALAQDVREVAAVPASQMTEAIIPIVSGIDLSDPENLQPVTETIAGLFSGEVLTGFLQRLETFQRARRAQDEANRQSMLRAMQVQRRGPYGQYGPGVVLPVVSNFARPLLELLEAIENLFKSAGAFVRGLCEGFSESVSEDQARQLSERLLESAILNVIFPPVFLSGAVVGIVEDVVDAVRGIYHLAVNFREMASAAIEFMGVFFTREGRSIAKGLGREIGKGFAGRITGMLRGNIFEFTYDLGKLVGPTIVYTVLALVGIPELLAASIAGRLISFLRPVVQRFPRLLRIAEAIASRLKKRRHRPELESDVDEAVERSFERTFNEPVPEREILPGEGVVGRGPLTRAQLAAVRRILLKRLDEFPVLQRLWQEAANPADLAQITAANSRRLFDNHRNRFWSRVRNNPEARRIFEDAGFEFPANSRTTAPIHRDFAGREGRVSLDHVTRREDNPARALDPTNLRIAIHGDNTLLENIQQAVGPRLRELGVSE